MNILTRRYFMKQSALASAGIAIGSMLNVPGFVRRALAQETFGWNGNKLLFIFLRGGNDSLNTIIPSGDPAYDPIMRPTLHIPGAQGIDLGNSFATMHPRLNDLMPLYNEGELSIIHRVAYPNQSRSHFDSEKYWETGVPRDDGIDEGIFYRTLVETGLHETQGIPGISFQSTMPLMLRGDIPFANMNDPARFDLLGVYAAARQKHIDSITRMHGHSYPQKRYRNLTFPGGERFVNTINQVEHIDFQDNASTPFFDDDGTTHLFPVDDQTDEKGFDDWGAWQFFKSLKYSAQVLAETDAVISGTELGGFDTHDNQGGAVGGVDGWHADLMSQVGWGLYALKKFMSHPSVDVWDKTIVVTMSEFGRTSLENGSSGTDHAEAGVMFVSGGAIKANNAGGVYQCDAGSWDAGVAGSETGSMFEVGGRYLSRRVDFRSVLGEIIREHLGASQAQLNRIIPGYGISEEQLMTGGTSVDGTPIIGELGLFS